MAIENQPLATPSGVAETPINKPAPKAHVSAQDDPLLMALMALCRVLHVPQTADALLAGLPLVNNKLTLELFPRAALRAGLSAALVKRPLGKISNLVLPAVLLLKNDQTCVLLRINEDKLTILVPESGKGEKTITHNELQKEYAGLAFFVQVQHAFDNRTGTIKDTGKRHWFWDVIFRSWPIYTEVIAASFLVNIFALVAPLFVMNVYDRVVPNHAIETLWVLAIGVAGVYIFDFIMKLMRGYFIDVAGKRADVILSSSIFERVMGIRLEGRPASVGAFVSNIHEFESFRDFFTSATLTTLVDLPFLVIFIAVIAMLGGTLALIPAVMLPLAVLGAFLVQGPMKNTTMELSRYAAEKGAMLHETLSSLELLKTLGAEGQMQRKWEQNINEIARLSQKTRLYSSFSVLFTSFLYQISYVGVVIYGVYKIAAGDMTTGGLIACTILTGRVLAPVSQIASLVTRLHHAKIALGTINNMMALPVERESGMKFLHRAQLKGTIDFKNVTFNYPEQPFKALNNVSFRINAGDKVGLIGRIGSGKSTIEKLIMGLYQPQEGSILIDGTDIRQLDPADLRRKIGYVPQDVMLLYGTLKDNITMGSRFVDDDAVLMAAELAGVTQFANRHPLGFDLPVGERGAALSGGQRQSVVLARAMLLNPPIYIMDEPTNSMDNSSEEAFKQRFQQHMGDKTLLLVTQKSSLLTLVDRLIIIDGGNVVADGQKDTVIEALRQGKIKIAT
jgi:ATP-binding cassette subfamily C protein LapB